MPTHIHYNPETDRFAFWSTITDTYTVYDMTESEALEEMAFKWSRSNTGADIESLEETRKSSGCKWGCKVYPTPDVCPTFDWRKAADVDIDDETGRDGQKKDWGEHGWGCVCP